MVCKPCPHVSVFVVRCVALNQIYFLWEIALQNSFEIHDVCFGIEDLVKVAEKSGAIQFDCAEYFERVSLPHSRYFRLRTYPRPCSIEGWVLPEARFVLKEDGRSFDFGFFLCWDSGSESIGIDVFCQLGPASSWGVGRKT